MLTGLCRELFGGSQSVRFRPSYFPFTEPSAEVDTTCPKCRRSEPDLQHVRRLGMDRTRRRGNGASERAARGRLRSRDATRAGRSVLGVERLGLARYEVDDIRRFVNERAGLSRAACLSQNDASSNKLAARVRRVAGRFDSDRRAFSNARVSGRGRSKSGRVISGVVTARHPQRRKTSQRRSAARRPRRRRRARTRSRSRLRRRTLRPGKRSRLRPSARSFRISRSRRVRCAASPRKA